MFVPSSHKTYDSWHQWKLGIHFLCLTLFSFSNWAIWLKIDCRLEGRSFFGPPSELLLPFWERSSWPLSSDRIRSLFSLFSERSCRHKTSTCTGAGAGNSRDCRSDLRAYSELAAEEVEYFLWPGPSGPVRAGSRLLLGPASGLPWSPEGPCSRPLRSPSFDFDPDCLSRRGSLTLAGSVGPDSNGSSSNLPLLSSRTSTVDDEPNERDLFALAWGKSSSNIPDTGCFRFMNEEVVLAGAGYHSSSSSSPSFSLPSSSERRPRREDEVLLWRFFSLWDERLRFCFFFLDFLRAEEDEEELEEEELEDVDEEEEDLFLLRFILEKEKHYWNRPEISHFSCNCNSTESNIDLFFSYSSTGAKLHEGMAAHEASQGQNAPIRWGCPHWTLLKQNFLNKNKNTHISLPVIMLPGFWIVEIWHSN